MTGTPTANEHTDSSHVDRWQDSRIGEVLESETSDGTPVYRIRLPDDKGWRRAAVFNQAVSRHCQRPDYRADVLQLVTALRPFTIPWIRRLRARGVAVAYAVTIAPKNPSSKPHKRVMRRWSTRLLYDQLDCIITNNSPLRDIVKEMGVKTPVEVIPNGVDLQRFHPLVEDDDYIQLRTGLGLGSNDFLVTTIGAVIPRKGCDLLLESWLRVTERFPTAHLVFIGPRTDLQDPKLEAFRRRLDELRRAARAPDNIHFAGEVSNVETWLRASDLFVLPSQREGMPNSVLEAMATNVPVVVTPFVGLSEDLGKPGQHFLLSEADAETLGDTISGLLANASMMAELGASGRRLVEQTMDLQYALDRYADTYRSLSERARSRR